MDLPAPGATAAAAGAAHLHQVNHPRRACAARRPRLGRPHPKAYEERLRHGIPPDDPMLFLEVTVADPSEFEARLQVTGEERHGYRDASPG